MDKTRVISCIKHRNYLFRIYEGSKLLADSKCIKRPKPFYSRQRF